MITGYQVFFLAFSLIKQVVSIRKAYIVHCLSNVTFTVEYFNIPLLRLYGISLVICKSKLHEDKWTSEALLIRDAVVFMLSTSSAIKVDFFSLYE